MPIDYDEIPEPEEKEFEKSETVHEIYDFGEPHSFEDISDFLENYTPGIEPEGYFVRWSYIDENGQEQWIQSSMHYLDEPFDWIEDIAEDMEAYGISGFSGVSVGYVGSA